MPRRTTMIVIRFKTPPLSLFATHEADPISVKLDGSVREDEPESSFSATS
jgi:hypothetical protein